MSLHARIAKALNWSEAETRTFSLPALRELVRPVSEKLVHEITFTIRSGIVVTDAPRFRRRPAIW